MTSKNYSTSAISGVGQSTAFKVKFEYRKLEVQQCMQTANEEV
jgi:hypothetical protein